MLLTLRQWIRKQNLFMGSCSKCCCYSVPSLGYASKKICLQLWFIWVIALLLNRDLFFLSHDKMKLQPIWPVAVVLSGKKSLLGASCSWEKSRNHLVS